jgi:hypothetical protein
MRPNPLHALDLPSNWPKHGKWGGKQIDLRAAMATLPHASLAFVVVDVPGKGEIQPWSDVAGFDDIELDPDLPGLMSREDLQASGSSDSQLEAWARGKGIRLSLAGPDVPDLQAIRADAWRRIIEESF